MLIAPLLLAVLGQTTPAAAPATPATPAPATPLYLAPPDPTKGWFALFDGTDLKNFYSFRNAEGKNNLPPEIFKVENGNIHVLDQPEPLVSQPNGYLATNEEFRNYVVRVEYQWGTKKLPVPRHPEGLPRDAGLLYHVSGNDTVWPLCIECQIQERDTGDIWLLPNNGANPSVTATINPAITGTANAYTFMPGGTVATMTRQRQRLMHDASYDNPTGWNVVEVYATEDSAVHVVNGRVNNALAEIRLPTGGPMTQGRVALQEENNEVFYRNVSIKPLFTTNLSGAPFKVLVFSKTAGFRHASIPDGIAAVKQLGAANNFSVDATEDAAAFTDANLKQYQAVIFMSTTGDVLNDVQQGAFERYIKAGGGFVGVHAASDTEYDWPWYGELVGAYFSKHPTGTPVGTIKIEDSSHPSTNSLPLTWTREDEWYNFRTNPRMNVHVLASLDEASLKDGGGEMNGDHPVIWYHDFQGGRSWYTALGHTKESYSDPLFLISLLGGIDYAAGVSGVAPAKASLLFDGNSTGAWVTKDRQPADWTVTDHHALEVKTDDGAGDLQTKDSFADFQLHVEFRVPPSPPTTDPKTRGESGLSLPGGFELKILDSFGETTPTKDSCGAIAGVQAPAMNASQPAQTWQSFDVTFLAAQNTRPAAAAHVTVYQNGVKILDNVALASASAATAKTGPAPLGLLARGSPVQFRNIWVKALPATVGSATVAAE